MSVPEETLKAVTKLISGQHPRTGDNCKYLLIHHPDPADPTQVTRAIISQPSTAVYRQDTSKDTLRIPDRTDNRLGKASSMTHTSYTRDDIDKTQSNSSSVSTSLTKWQRHKNFGPKHPCNICKKMFTSPWQVKRHAVVHTGEKPYTCSTCSQSFSQLGQLRDHQSIHTGEWKFTCTVCNAGFNKNYLFKTHIIEQQHVDNNTIPRHLYMKTCNVCGKEVKNGALKPHMLTHLTEKERNILKIHKCAKCGRGFNRRYNLMAHMASHSDTKPFECSICKREFKRKTALREHQTRCDSHFCKHCKTYIYGKDKFKKHIRKCCGVDVLQCKFCDKTFLHDQWLGKHVARHHSERSEKWLNESKSKIFSLPPDELELPASASNRDSLKTLHTCGICFKQFAKTIFIRVHMKKHSTSEVCSCKKCNTWYTVKSELNDHACVCDSTIIYTEYDEDVNDSSLCT